MKPDNPKKIAIMKSLVQVSLIAASAALLFACGDGAVEEKIDEASQKIEQEVQAQSEEAAKALDSAVEALESSEAELENALEDL